MRSLLKRATLLGSGAGLDKTDASGTYVAPAVVGPKATGIAATDTADLWQALNDTPDGGRLWLPSSPTFFAYDPSIHQLTSAKNITIEGDALTATYGSVEAGNSSEEPASPFLAGAVLKVVTAGYDAIVHTGTAKTLNLRNLGILFQSGLASTGAGIKGRPATVSGAGHDYGLTAFVWENVLVYGHDGNHTAFDLLNSQGGLLVQCMSWGGGGLLFTTDASNVANAGNHTVIGQYAFLSKAGTAHGIAHSAATAAGVGAVNLITYVRPQVNVSGAAATAGTQSAWNDLVGASVPANIRVFGADFESPNPVNGVTVKQGSGTQFFGSTQVATYSLSNTVMGDGALPSLAGQANQTAYGQRALQGATSTSVGNTGVGTSALLGLTSGNNNTGVGLSALGAAGASSNSTAVGYQALAANTATANTAVGSGALALNTSATANTAVGYHAAGATLTGGNLTAVGYIALQSATGGNNTAVGAQAGSAVTTGSSNTLLGALCGQSILVGANNTLVGKSAGTNSVDTNGATALGSATVAVANSLALGLSASATGNGSVALGTDNTGAGTSVTTNNTIALGNANHKVRISNNTSGAGSAALGANCPAVTATAPYTWFAMLSSDGSTVYVPAWK